MSRMRHVVFDECDMLLSGGFEAPTRLILTMLKELDRARMVSAICADLSLSEADFRSLPLLMRRTGLAGEPFLSAWVLEHVHCIALHCIALHCTAAVQLSY